MYVFLFRLGPNVLLCYAKTHYYRLNVKAMVYRNTLDVIYLFTLPFSVSCFEQF